MKIQIVTTMYSNVINYIALSSTLSKKKIEDV